MFQKPGTSCCVLLRRWRSSSGDPGTIIRKRQRPPCPIVSPAVKDSEWIPQVAGRGWLIITRDRHIQEHRLEIAAVREPRARMVVLTAADAGSVFG
ncbi:hypothetical protein [Micromonospora mirobrigensis]|uniref:PIN-like domain-containing protein n=1 Tax=Micromonospora mirobrigensis TaxID=262898 RepID=UPI00159F3412